MTTTSHVLSDMAALRSELHQQGDPHCELFRLAPWRAVLDIAFDWLVVLSAVALVLWWSELFAPLAVVLIANWWGQNSVGVDMRWVQALCSCAP